jgi:hypothetical protein
VNYFGAMQKISLIATGTNFYCRIKGGQETVAKAHFGAQGVNCNHENYYGCMRNVRVLD